jgi:integrase
MGRRRHKHHDLPPRMHLKGGSYYHVTFVDGRRDWKAIGKTYGEAVVHYAEREAADFRRGEMFEHLADEFTLRILPGYAAKTQKEWRRCIGKLKGAFKPMRVGDIKPHHLATMRDKMRSRPGIANRMLTIMRTIYKYGVEWNYVTVNPGFGIDGIETEERTRYLTDEEFALIRSKAPPPAAAAMAISYVTGLRIGDVLKLTAGAITDQGIVLRQQKNKVAAVYPVTPDVRSALELAKTWRKVGSIYLISRRDGKPLTYSGFRSIYDRAVKKAGVEDTTFHDIRAKAITDAKNREGRDPQSFSRHKTKAQADAYVRVHEVPVVEPLKLPIVEKARIVENSEPEKSL